MPHNRLLVYRQINPQELPPEKRVLLDHPCCAVCYYDKTLGYFGAIQIWTGVAEVWTRLTEKARYHLSLIFHELPEALELFQERNGWHKMYCHCTPEDRHFAELLGFDPIALLPNRAPDGSDYWTLDFVGTK